MSNSSIIPLNSKDHTKLTYSHLADYSFTSDKTAVPLMNFEVIQAAECFPIIFPDTNNVVPYAMLGLGKSNIFVDKKGKWKARYLPLMFANHPFSLVAARFTESTDKKSEFAIGIEEDAPEFAQKKGLPLYNDNGEPSETLVKIKNALASQLTRHTSFQPSLNELNSFNCFEEAPISIEFNGKKRTVNGLRCVSREKILALPDDVLGHLVKTRVMEVLYAHWQSLRHLPLLLEDPSCQSAVKHEPIQ